MHVIYVLPKKDYFSEGPRGRVSHARGVADGLALQGIPVTAISGPQTKSHFKHASAIEVSGSGRWLDVLFNEIRSQVAATKKPITVIIRYSSSNGYRFLSLFRETPSVQWCFEVNSLIYHNRADLPRIVRRGALFVESKILAKADCLYLVSEKLKRDVAGKHDAQRYLVIPNGGPAPISISAKAFSRPFRFVYFGVLQQYYNFDTVVQGFATARTRGLDAELHIFGYGTQLEALQSLVNGMEGIVLHGRYELQQLITEELSSNDSALILPYASDDINDVGSPIKMFEYLATGLPIIASGSGGVQETLEHEKSALLVGATEPEQWAQAMLRIRDDDALRERLSAYVRSTYLEHTWESRMRDLYAGLKTVYAQTQPGETHLSE